MFARQRLGFAIASATAGVMTCISCQAFAEQAIPAIAGMVRQTEIRIAPDGTGRLASVAVNPGDRKSTRLNSSHVTTSRMPSSA